MSSAISLSGVRGLLFLLLLWLVPRTAAAEGELKWVPLNAWSSPTPPTIVTVAPGVETNGVALSVQPQLAKHQSEVIGNPNVVWIWGPVSVTNRVSGEDYGVPTGDHRFNPAGNDQHDSFEQNPTHFITINVPGKWLVTVTVSLAYVYDGDLYIGATEVSYWVDVSGVRVIWSRAYAAPGVQIVNGPDRSDEINATVIRIGGAMAGQQVVADFNTAPPTGRQPIKLSNTNHTDYNYSLTSTSMVLGANSTSVTNTIRLTSPSNYPSVTEGDYQLQATLHGSDPSVLLGFLPVSIVQPGTWTDTVHDNRGFDGGGGIGMLPEFDPNDNTAIIWQQNVQFTIFDQFGYALSNKWWPNNTPFQELGYDVNGNPLMTMDGNGNPIPGSENSWTRLMIPINARLGTYSPQALNSYSTLLNNAKVDDICSLGWQFDNATAAYNVRNGNVEFNYAGFDWIFGHRTELSDFEIFPVQTYREYRVVNCIGYICDSDAW